MYASFPNLPTQRPLPMTAMFSVKKGEIPVMLQTCRPACPTTLEKILLHLKSWHTHTYSHADMSCLPTESTNPAIDVIIQIVPVHTHKELICVVS